MIAGSGGESPWGEPNIFLNFLISGWRASGIGTDDNYLDGNSSWNI